MADERIEISVSRADWDKMSPDQRADFTFSALQYLVCATKESKFSNSFLAVAGGIIGGLIVWLPLILTSSTKIVGG